MSVHGHLARVVMQKEGYAALQVATVKGHFDCVEWLLQTGADVNQRDVRASTPRTIHRSSSVALVLQSDGFSALQEAAFRGHEDIARLLLRWGADKSFVNAVRRALLVFGNVCCSQVLNAPPGRLNGAPTGRAPRLRSHRLHAVRRPQCREGLLLRMGPCPVPSISRRRHD